MVGTKNKGKKHTKTSHSNLKKKKKDEQKDVFFLQRVDFYNWIHSVDESFRRNGEYLPSQVAGRVQKHSHS